MTHDHLDDEALSAALDGHDAGPHLAGCGACRARLEDLRRVAALVGAPPPPPPAGAADAAVAAALAAVGEVVPLRPRRRDLRPILAVAAVLLALLVAVPVLSGLGDDGQDGDVAAGGGGAALDSAAPAGPVADLGPLDADRIAEFAAQRTAAVAGTGALTDTESKAMVAEGADDDGDEESAEERDCLSTLGRPDAPVLRATGTWEGEAADVLVFVDGEDDVAYVTARSDCRILYFARL